MKKFISKYKVKILLTFLFALLLLLLNNNVFALTFVYEDETISIDLPEDFDADAHPDFVITLGTKNVSRKYQLGYPVSDYDLPFICTTTGDPNGIQYYKAGTTTNGQWYYYNYYEDTGWSSVKTTSMKTICLNANSKSEGTVIFSSSDIYYTDGTLFFQQTPVGKVLLEAMKTLKMEDYQTAQIQILKILPVILSVLVSLIALRKALKMLSVFLRTS